MIDGVRPYRIFRAIRLPLRVILSLLLFYYGRVVYPPLRAPFDTYATPGNLRGPTAADGPGDN